MKINYKCPLRLIPIDGSDKSVEQSDDGDTYAFNLYIKK